MELWCGWSKRWDLVRPRGEICVSTGREGSLGCEEGVNRSQKSVQEQLRSLRISYMFPFAARSQPAVVSDCDSVDCSPPSSYVHGVFQARILEWIAISSSRGSSHPNDQTVISCVSCIGRQILLPLSYLGSLSSLDTI